MPDNQVAHMLAMCPHFLKGYVNAGGLGRWPQSLAQQTASLPKTSKPCTSRDQPRYPGHFPLAMTSLQLHRQGKILDAAGFQFSHNTHDPREVLPLVGPQVHHLTLALLHRSLGLSL